MSLRMLDGINADAAAIHRFAPSSPVGTYVNGEFAWSPLQESWFARKIRISVETGQPGAARFARVLDVERGAAGFNDVGPFLAERAKLDNRGTVYCDVANVPAVLDAIGRDVDRVPRWWIAWYWQRPGAPTAQQVNDEIGRLTGVLLPLERIWACQHIGNKPIPGGACDVSAVYGLPDFSR